MLRRNKDGSVRKNARDTTGLTPRVYGDRVYFVKGVELRAIKIEDGVPIPPPIPRVYTSKLAHGELAGAARLIQPGQSCVIPTGSTTVFRRNLRPRGLSTITRGINHLESRVWVVGYWESEEVDTPQPLTSHGEAENSCK